MESLYYLSLLTNVPPTRGAAMLTNAEMVAALPIAFWRMDVGKISPM